jgi:hypothetical protein
MEDKIIIIKPVNRVKFAGQSSYSGTHTAIEGAQMGRSGYKTGLTVKEEKEFEEKLGLKQGTLSSSNNSFWGSVLNLSLPNDKPYYMAIRSDMDELKLKVIQQHSRIANNEIELGKNPKAEFYIEDLESKAVIEEEVMDSKMMAHELFTELSGSDKKSYLKLFGKKGVNEMSDRVIKTTLFKEIEANPEKFISLIKNPDIKVRIEIEEMLETGIVTKKGQYYQFENEVIGSSIDAVVGFFKDYKNQSIKIAAKAASKEKLKGSNKEDNDKSE